MRGIIRKQGTLRNPQAAKCIVCGEKFIKDRAAKITCSPECSERHKKEYKSRYSKEYYEFNHAELADKARKRRYENPQARCAICGELMIRNINAPNRKTRMHEECIVRDCIETLKQGKSVSHVQYLRLQSRGWTLAEFKNEYLREE